MTDSSIRYANLDRPPVWDREIRLCRGDAKVSIWLPADAMAVAEAMRGLAGVGFELARTAEHVPTVLGRNADTTPHGRELP